MPTLGVQVIPKTKQQHGSFVIAEYIGMVGLALGGHMCF